MLSDGARLLAKWIEDRELTKAAAAKQLGVSPPAVQYWLTGGQRPRSDIRDRIAKWTGGAVPAESWLTDDERAALEMVEAPPDSGHHENGNGGESAA